MNGARVVHDRLELAGWDVEIADALKHDRTVGRPRPNLGRTRTRRSDRRDDEADGGDLNGFMLLRGDPAKLHAVRVAAEWRRLVPGRTTPFATWASSPPFSTRRREAGWPASKA